MQCRIEFRIFMESHGHLGGVPRIVGKGEGYSCPTLSASSKCFTEYIIVGLY